MAMKTKLFAVKMNYLIGEFLWRERHHFGVDRPTVALYCGISEVQLKDYEKGTVAIPANLLCKLAVFYKVERPELHYFLESVFARARKPWGRREFSEMILHRQKVL